MEDHQSAVEAELGAAAAAGRPVVHCQMLVPVAAGRLGGCWQSPVPVAELAECAEPQKAQMRVSLLLKVHETASMPTKNCQ